MNLQQSSPILLSPSVQKSQELKAFKKILQDVGIDLSFNDEPHILKQEQALVLKNLENILESSPEKCEELLNGLKLLCKKQKHFQKALSLTNLKKNHSNNRMKRKAQDERIEQESLMRLSLTFKNCCN